MNYYNDNEPFACQWLKNLIEAELIPPGHVDQRSIKEVQPDDLAGYTQCHFFAGIGGWSEALRLASWPADVPVWTGSCPCQPLSCAGKREGEMDERHLWPDFYRLIAQCRPAIIFGEQVASNDGLEWLDGVSLDLEELDYAFAAADLPAACEGAPQIRQRLWWLAESQRSGVRLGGCGAIESATGGVQKANGKRKRIRVDAGAVGKSVAHRLALAGPSSTRGDSRPERPPEESSAVEGERRGETAIESERCRETGGLGDSHSERHDGEPVPILARRSQQAGLETAGGSAVGRLGNSEPDGLRAGWRATANESEQSGHWSVFQVVQCADGSARRIEPSAFPLAHGLPRRLGQSQSAMAGMARPASGNRHGRLSGYGNAIVPAAAAKFIRAYLEAKLPSG